MKSFSIETRLKWINRTVYFFLVVGILLSLRLWLSDRLFPLSPFFDGFSLRPPIDLALLSLFLIAVGLNFFLLRKAILYLIVAMLILIMSSDQMRLQPWVFIYFLLLLPFLFTSGWTDNHYVMNSIQLVIPGVYVWSGLHKLNHNFIDYTKSILQQVTGIKDLLPDSFANIILLIPVVEIITGLALIFPKFRNVGVAGATTIHISILILIGPFGAGMNSIIWPWNIAMICLVMFAFYRQTNKIVLFVSHPLNVRILNIILVVLVWLLPSMNFFKLWDHYLSFSLYSGKINDFYIAVNQNELKKIDKDLHNYFVKIDGLQGGEIIDIQKWSMEELNVPFTGQRRVFKNVCKHFCNLGVDNNAMYFLEVRRKDQNAIQSLTCRDLDALR